MRTFFKEEKVSREKFQIDIMIREWERVNNEKYQRKLNNNLFYSLSKISTLILLFLHTHCRAGSSLKAKITSLISLVLYSRSNISCPAIICPMTNLLRFCFASINSTDLPSVIL